MSKDLVVETKRAEHLGQILEMYMRGISLNQISTELNLTKNFIEHTLNSFRKDYLSTLSIRGVLPRYDHLDKSIDAVNQPFFALMSKPDEPLSNEEMLYCALYVGTGNSIEALKTSGLDVGLTKGTKEIYDKNCLLRSEMLKRKANIQLEIRRLQKERQEYRDSTKDRILEMHLDLIEQLTEEGNPSNKTTIVKLLDQVNKMQGNYSIEVRRGEISADDVLDGMLEAATHEVPDELKNVMEGGDYESEEATKRSKEAYKDNQEFSGDQVSGVSDWEPLSK